MCGIIGVASIEALSPQDISWIEKGLNNMYHRGPDSGGLWKSKNLKVVLGHRRLSIIDRTPDANQPMRDVDNTIVIVFNGEIYNYQELREYLEKKGFKFKTKSDTEVLIYAYKHWGVNFVSYINGMFAIAIYDIVNDKFFLIRDRVGKKPLFYMNYKGQLRFASELKGLLADEYISRKCSLNSLDYYLTFGFVPGGQTILEGFNKLPPAHILSYDLKNGKLKIWKYWCLPEPSSHGRSIYELLDEFESLFLDSIRMRLIADVPIGILLSGGLDSSLITAVASQLNNNIKTFSVIFPGHRNFDESKYSRLIAKHFDTNHFELSIDSITPEILYKLAVQYDEPIIDSSMIPTYLITKLVREHCIVALGGDGGDELFGGYSYYLRVLRAINLSKKIPFLIRLILENAINKMPHGVKGKKYVDIIFSKKPREKLVHTYYFSPWERRKLIGKSFNTKLNFKIYDDIIETLTRMDFRYYLPEDILVKTDRASMLNSLELRAPFLDYRIVEFAFGNIPSVLKVNINKGTKIFLKLFADKILPADFNKKRKQGFSLPLNMWLKDKRSPWYKFFQDVLLTENSLFDKKYINQLFFLHRNFAFIDNSERLFGLALFVLWAKMYRINF